MFNWKKAKEAKRGSDNQKGQPIAKSAGEQIKIADKTKIDNFRTLAENANDGILIADEQGKHFFANRRAAEITGYNIEELLNISIKDLAHPDEIPMLSERLKRRMQGESIPSQYVTRIVRKDGAIVFIEITITILIWEGKAVLVILRDISDRKQMEENLQKMTRLFEQLTANIHEVIWTSGMDMKLNYVSPSIVHLLGYTPEEMIDLSMDSLTPNSLSKIKKAFQIGFPCISDETINRRMEIEQIKKDGTKIWVEIEPSVLLDDSGKPQGIIGVSRDITHRKEVEAELAHYRGHLEELVQERTDQLIKSEEKYRLLAENLSDVIWTMDFNLRFTYMSSSVERLRGYTVEEAVALSLEESLTPDSWSIATETFEREMSLELSGKGEPNREAKLEVEQPCKDGSTVQVEAQMKFLRDSDGKPIGILGITRDITERKRTEQLLKKQNELLKLVNELSTSFIDVSMDRIDEKIVDALRMATEYVGGDRANIFIFSPDEKKIGKVYQWHNPEVAPLPPEIEGLETGIFPWWSEQLLSRGEIRVSDISDLPAEAVMEKEIFSRQNVRSLVSIPLIHPSLVGSMSLETVRAKKIWLDEDMTVLKMLRDVLGNTLLRKRTEEMLRESEQQFRSFTETSSAAIFIYQGTKFRYINPAALAAVGYTKEELFSKEIWELVHPEFRELAKGRGQARFKGEDIPARYEMKLIRKDGSEIWVDFTASLVEFEGRPAILGTAFDITDMKRAQREKEVLQAQLLQAQKMEAIGTLAGGIAHDLNNIFQTIVNNSYLSREELPKRHPALKGLKGILNSCKHAKDLIDQILTFSRNVEKDLKPCRVVPMINETIKMLRTTLPKNIEIKQRILDLNGSILASPTQFHQVMMNLCTNAAHAMRENGGILEVTLKRIDLDGVDADLPVKLPPGSYIHFSVMDTGEGMDSATQSRAFDPFFTTKKVGEGTGLGLSVVHGIVTALGGKIHLASEPKKGTLVEIFIPRFEVESEEETEETAEVEGKERILFVDDDEEQAKTGKILLEKAGQIVEAYTESRKALETFKSIPKWFDLVIADMVMPEMSGLELASAILQINPQMPVMLITGKSTPGTDEKAYQCGIRRIIKKPYTPEELNKAIRELLDEKMK